MTPLFHNLKTRKKKINVITVYTKNNCVQCAATLKYMAKLGIENYTIVNVDDDARARDQLIAMGFTSAPVVDPGDDSDAWSGFQPVRIATLVH